MAPSHIIFIPLPAQGHVAPLLHFSTVLAQKGFTITIINIDTIHASLQHSWKIPPGYDIHLESLPLGHLSGPSLLELAQALIRMQEPLAELIKTIDRRGPKVACVVSDFFHHSGALAAHDAGLPSVGFVCGMAAWASIEMFTSDLISNGDIPVKDGDDNLITYLPGLKLRSGDLPHYLNKPEFSEEGLDTLLHRLKRVKLDSWVLVTSVYEFEPEVFDAVKGVLGAEFAAIGPMLPTKDTSPVSLKVEDRACLEWFDKQALSSVIYISFGSLVVISPEQFKELALGVEASKQPFLWIIRSGLVPEMDEAFCQAFLERTKDIGMIAEWCPQLEVLHHRATGGFLTHSGWNSVMESIVAGVPMLGYPFMIDQKLNTKLMLEGKGVGLPLERGPDGIVSRDEVERKIKLLLVDGEENLLRKKARELSEVARKATEPGGSSDTNIQGFIARFLAGPESLLH